MKAPLLTVRAVAANSIGCPTAAGFAERVNVWFLIFSQPPNTAAHASTPSAARTPHFLPPPGVMAKIMAQTGALAK